MLIIPNHEECLDENGKFSEKKFNEAFDKIFKLMKETESENKIVITSEMLEHADKHLWKNFDPKKVDN